MNKTATFLIVVVLAARGMIYISDYNKSKIQKLETSDNSYSEPKAMNMNEPRPGSEMNELKVVADATVTFLLAGDNEIYYYKGRFNGVLQKTGYDKVGSLIRKYKNTINSTDLMFIIKSDEGTTFKDAINILDQMSTNNIPPGHYAEVDISKEESARINFLKNTKNG